VQGKGGEKLIPEAEQKAPKSSEELVQVHGGGAEDGVDGITGGPLEAVALHTVLTFEVADGGLDGGAAFHPSPETFGRRAPATFVHMDCFDSLVIMSPIAHVDMGLLHFGSDAPTHLRELPVQRVPVVEPKKAEPKKGVGLCGLCFLT